MALPTLWMAPLLMVILAAAFVAPWSTIATVDERTYLEMSLGIQETGLPLIENGPVDRFPQLQARWNLYREGRLWGAMAPGLPFVAARLLDLGGIRTVIRMNLALLALLAVAIALAGRELTDDPMVGVAASYIGLVSIPLWTSSFGLLPYSLAITGFAWALFFGARAQKMDQARWAILAGLASGLALTCQLLVFPMIVGLVAVLAVRRSTLGWMAALGVAPSIAALAWLNHLRFGSWNPLSDGPCAWQGCPDSGADPQSLGHMVMAAMPVVGWLAALGLLVFGLRKRAPAVKAAAILLAFLPLALWPSLLHELVGYGLLGWRLLVDVGVWEKKEQIVPATDGLGTFIGPHVVKALLQSSPALVLTAFARLPRQRLALLWLPVAALLAMLLLRVGMPVEVALGHPFLNQRYLAPAAPALAILAAVGARRLSWGLRQVALAALTAASLRWLLQAGVDDFELWRRLLLLRAPLLIAVTLVAATTFALRDPAPAKRRATTILAAIAFGWGAGVSLGVDLAATVRLRDQVESRVYELASRLPDRFALVGHPTELDAPLTLKAQRDVQYLDLKEVTSSDQETGPILWWLHQRRPVYALLPPADDDEMLGGDLALQVVEPALGLARVRAPGRGSWLAPLPD